MYITSGNVPKGMPMRHEAVAAAVPNVIQKHQKVFKKCSDNEERFTRLMPSRVNQKNRHLPYWSLKLMEAHWGH